MRIIITGTPKEIAALVVAVREQQAASAEGLTVGFPGIDSPYTYANNLVTKHNNVSNGDRGSD